MDVRFERFERRGGGGDYLSLIMMRLGDWDKIVAYDLLNPLSLFLRSFEEEALRYDLFRFEWNWSFEKLFSINEKNYFNLILNLLLNLFTNNKLSKKI